LKDADSLLKKETLLFRWTRRRFHCWRCLADSIESISAGKDDWMEKERNASRVIILKRSFAVWLVCLSAMLWQCRNNNSTDYGEWMEKPQTEWPQITMINQIEYTDKNHPIAGCGFLLDTGDEILAATAKHILIYFKSDSMKTVSFGNALKLWRMFPKNNPGDAVVLDKLINENPKEPLERIPPERDWLLFTIKVRSRNIQPLKFRFDPMQEGEAVYIIGWRYTDTDCSQVIYKGNLVLVEEGSFLITTNELADNTTPGLSGSPVIDSNGYLLGLMSQKAGKMERSSSIDYPKMLVQGRANTME
jgi:hypothetical protein